MTDRKAQMRKLIKGGWTLQRVADRFDLSRQRVGQIVGKVGRKSPVRDKVERNIDRIGKLYAEGKSFCYIARKVGLPPNSLGRILGVPSNFKATVAHGTANAYQYHKCRCEECRVANNQLRKARVHERRRKGQCIGCGASSPDHWRCNSCAARFNTQLKKRRGLGAN